MITKMEIACYGRYLVPYVNARIPVRRFCILILELKGLNPPGVVVLRTRVDPEVWGGGVTPTMRS